MESPKKELLESHISKDRNRQNSTPDNPARRRIFKRVAQALVVAPLVTLAGSADRIVRPSAQPSFLETPLPYTLSPEAKDDPVLRQSETERNHKEKLDFMKQLTVRYLNLPPELQVEVDNTITRDLAFSDRSSDQNPAYAENVLLSPYAYAKAYDQIQKKQFWIELNLDKDGKIEEGELGVNLGVDFDNYKEEQGIGRDSSLGTDKVKGLLEQTANKYVKPESQSWVFQENSLSTRAGIEADQYTNTREDDWELSRVFTEGDYIIRESVQDRHIQIKIKRRPD